jgi:hypothetical protein
VFQMRLFKQHGGLHPDVPTASTLVPEELDPHSLLPAVNSANTEAFAS